MLDRCCVTPKYWIFFSKHACIRQWDDLNALFTSKEVSKFVLLRQNMLSCALREGIMRGGKGGIEITLVLLKNNYSVSQ